MIISLSREKVRYLRIDGHPVVIMRTPENNLSDKQLKSLILERKMHFTWKKKNIEYYFSLFIDDSSIDGGYC